MWVKTNQSRLRDFFDGVDDKYVKPTSKEIVKPKKSLLEFIWSD